MVGDVFKATSIVHLGELRPDEVKVELYYGPIQSLERIDPGMTEIMSVEEDLGNGTYRYACTFHCDLAGRYGFTTRATP